MQSVKAILQLSIQSCPPGCSRHRSRHLSNAVRQSSRGCGAGPEAAGAPSPSVGAGVGSSSSGSAGSCPFCAATSKDIMQGSIPVLEVRDIKIAFSNDGEDDNINGNVIREGNGADDGRNEARSDFLNTNGRGKDPSCSPYEHTDAYCTAFKLAYEAQWGYMWLQYDCSSGVCK